MPLPELGTPERATAERRVLRSITDAAYNVAVERDLPPQVHVLVRDTETGEKIAAFLQVQRTEDKGFVNVALNLKSAGVLPSEETVEDAADILIRTNPGMPMICNKDIIDAFTAGALTHIEGKHYQLNGNPNGSLDIYAPREELPYSRLFPPSGF